MGEELVRCRQRMSSVSFVYTSVEWSDYTLYSSGSEVFRIAASDLKGS